MTLEEEAKIVREAFEKFPMVIIPNIIDNRYPKDANREKRNIWLSERLGRKVV